MSRNLILGHKLILGEGYSEDLQRLSRTYVLFEDDIDIYYTLECENCGMLSYSSCVGSPDSATDFPCTFCGGQKRILKHSEETEPMGQEAWDDLYEND